MTPFFVAIFLIGLSSLATAVNFTQVFEWPDGLDYEWPSEAIRAQALKDRIYKPENMSPRYMAVYGSRIFLSLAKDIGIPAALVSLPTSSASSAPPKLTPFPSWDIHLNEPGHCNKIQRARGLQVDSVGRLWVLNAGSDSCNATLWIFNLNNNETELIHRFSFYFYIHDLVLDETANGTFAYVARWMESHVVVFSLERNESWIVDTSGIDVSSIALSPKEKEPRQLYIGELHSTQFHSISVAALRNGTRTIKPKVIGNWNRQRAYRMLMDNHGTLHAAFMYQNLMSSWNTSQSFYQVAGLKSSWPFTFALDQNGTLWMSVFDDAKFPRFGTLNAAVGAKSFILARMLQHVHPDTA
ncbi:protein yellow-like [Cloeon dipterum]|uniref:protein yellow-like n=1 Tax=Cloeon dipterum TaxID=197152 RepID=UPI00321FEA0E